MSLKNISSLFNFPLPCKVNQRISKALFMENKLLTAQDKKIITADIEEMTCMYVLNADKCHVNAYSDDEHEYSCLAILEITLRKLPHVERIAELCHRAMPYPLLLCFCDMQGGVLFAMSEKRLSRDHQARVVLENSVITPWQKTSQLSHFLKLADYPTLAKPHFKAVHQHYFELLEALNCAHLTGHLCIESVDPTLRRQYLAQHHALSLQLAALKSQAAKEVQLPRTVELNMQAQHIKLEIKNIENKLKQQGVLI